MRTMIQRMMPLAALAMAAACGTAMGGADQAGVPGPDQQVIQVHNRGWQPVRVYVLRGSSPIRLGRVEALGTQQFALRPGMLGTTGKLQLMLRPLGPGPGYTIDPVRVGDNGFVELDVEREIRLSSVAVFSHAMH